MIEKGINMMTGTTLAAFLPKLEILLTLLILQIIPLMKLDLMSKKEVALMGDLIRM
jgi:hypothetical protein